jgi:hypothetical protein
MNSGNDIQPFCTSGDACCPFSMKKFSGTPPARCMSVFAGLGGARS